MEFIVIGAVIIAIIVVIVRLNRKPNQPAAIAGHPAAVSMPTQEEAAQAITEFDMLLDRANALIEENNGLINCDPQDATSWSPVQLTRAQSTRETLSQITADMGDAAQTPGPLTIMYRCGASGQLLQRIKERTALFQVIQNLNFRITLATGEVKIPI